MEATTDAFGEFEWRGMVYDATEGVRDHLRQHSTTVYAGFDPTAASLHVGSLLPIMALARLQRLGHTPIALVGGGTGLIGDPSGKSAERTLLTPESVRANADGIRSQLARFLDFDVRSNPARLVNNLDWLSGVSALEFMRDVGKHFTVNHMLAKESVRRRVESEDGISYTEFSYLLLQAYDYLVLHDRFSCMLQIGGSDQWGNITAGMDLIRKLRASRAHGLVLPLLVTAAGAKFGKTEAGTIWLDPALTRPYEFYQFWLNVDDRDVLRYLRLFTWLSAATIDELAAAFERRPEDRLAQRTLACEVTRIAHGDEAARDAESASRKLFSGSLSEMSVAELLAVFKDVPSWETADTPNGWAVVDLLIDSGVVHSRGEALRLLRGGGIYVNDRKVTDEKARFTATDAIGGQVLVIRKGKRANHLILIRRA